MDSILTKTQPKYFIETYGCQMNKYDSELLAGIFRSEGYQPAEDPDQADVLVINTCSVRDHAEQRALGRLSVLAGWKRDLPGRRIGVVGCMGQNRGRRLIQEKPFVDFILGPDEYRKLPSILRDPIPGGPVHTCLDGMENYAGMMPRRENGVTGWIAVMRGCDNFCSYCIVPLTRGRERSRPASEVLDELRKMLDEGFRDITLLGQNLNSYNDGRAGFPDLLREAARIPSPFRLRFMTSHPKDLSDSLLDVMASEPKICPHLHLPAQSGSDRILGLMNRSYTSGDYRRLVDKARRMIPGLALSTDVMTGFPSETEADFQDTCSLMKEIRFDDAYLYHFSAREGTPAAQMPDQVPEAERLSRLERLIRIQRAISIEAKKGWIGRQVEVIPEGASKKSPDEWMGKTPGNEVVVFPKDGTRLGETVRVRITGCRGSTLRGLAQPAGGPAFTD